MTEREGFTSRTDHGDGVYSASQWPADEPMCMHHELSYADEVPSLALFGCLTAPASGGATAVADARTLLRTLPAGLVERFEREGWLLDRDYREVGVSRLKPSAPRTVPRRPRTAPATPSRTSGWRTARCAPASGVPR